MVKNEETRSEPEVIEFYLANEVPYGAFSNLSYHPVTVDGVTYPTAEHAYHAPRFTDPKVAAWMMSCPTAGLLAHVVHEVFDPAKKHGQQYTSPDWGEDKLNRMSKVLRAKFSQHEELRDLLLGTGDAVLVEAGFIDDDAGRFWGQVNGKGKNHLGRLLMQVRSEFQTVVIRKVPDEGSS